MHARAIDEAQARLFELHNDEIQDIALGGVALSASLASTALFPPLAVPLFVGGVTMGILGIRALWRHWDLLDRLADDRDAYAIRQVREYAARDARMGRRAHFAELARSWARAPDVTIAEVARRARSARPRARGRDLRPRPGCRTGVSTTSHRADGQPAFR